MRPPIGINCDLEANRRALGDTRLVSLNPDYARCVARAGGIPLLLPPLPLPLLADALESTLDAIAGLVLVGGADMDPAEYGERPRPEIEPLDPERDAYDLALARAALRRGIPVLGICGGMQLLNVARGGSLHQHLPAALEGLVPVHVDQEREPRSHAIDVAPGSVLHALIGPRLAVNSRHHQAVARLGRGLRVVARAEDGVIEAFEDEGADGGSFVLGVQWHPEESGDPVQDRLFAELVRRARPVAAPLAP